MESETEKDRGRRRRRRTETETGRKQPSGDRSTAEGWMKLLRR